MRISVAALTLLLAAPAAVNAEDFAPLSCNDVFSDANFSVDSCVSFKDVIVPAAATTPGPNVYVDAITLAAVATQSCTYEDDPNAAASKAIDGSTNYELSGGSVAHTCSGGGKPWWMVDLGSEDVAIEKVTVYNRVDCCQYRMNGAIIEVLDNKNITVASMTASGTEDEYEFNFGGVKGQYIRISKEVEEALNIAEVKVTGAYGSLDVATSPGTYEHKILLDSNSTIEYATGEAHIPCGVCAKVDYFDGDVVEIPRGINVEGMLYFPPEASVELRVPHLFVQGNLTINAPEGRNAIKVHLTGEEGVNGQLDQMLIPHSDNAGACDFTGCNYGTKAVVVAGGTLDIQALPDPSCPTWVKLKSIDEDNLILEVGTEAAVCWSNRTGDEILITDTVHMGVPYKSLTATIASADVDAGTVTLDAPPVDKEGMSSAGYISTLANDPDFPAEVAWLSRSVVFDADVYNMWSAGGTEWWCERKRSRGGHLIVDQTPGVAQKIEGVEFQNFGQGANLGRYPIHFHYCADISDTVVSKNLVRSSHQRCIVIHQSHNVTVEGNIAFGHLGHCFMLEDGVEEGNVFKENLGTDGWRLSCAEGIMGEKDDFEASTFWISDARNEFTDNVAAGAINGYWFDRKVSCVKFWDDYPLNNRYCGYDLTKFSGNIAHSNLLEGLKFYRGGYSPESTALIEDSKSYRNYVSGVRLHTNKNLLFKGLLLADNGIGISSFDNVGKNEFEDVHVIGLTEKARQLWVADGSGEMIVYPYPSEEVLAHPRKEFKMQDSGLDDMEQQYQVDGIKFAYDPDVTQLVLRNVFLEGFEPHTGAEEFDILALRYWAIFPGAHGADGSILQGGDARFHGMPSLDNVRVASVENSFDLREPNDSSLYFQDIDGTMNSEGQGAFIADRDDPGIHSYLTANVCSKANDRTDSYALFCPGCIRRVITYSNCEDLEVKSDSSDAASTFEGFTDTRLGSTRWHEFSLPDGNYVLTCKDQDVTVRPKFLMVTFDGETDYIHSNKGISQRFDRPAPSCSPYVGLSSFTLPEFLLHQHIEGEMPIAGTGWGDNTELTADGIFLVPGASVTYGPLNFGLPGETAHIRLNYTIFSYASKLTVTLGDGTTDKITLANYWSLLDVDSGWTCDGCVPSYIRDIPVDENVEGVHEVTILYERWTGTKPLFVLHSLELLPAEFQEHFDVENATNWGGVKWEWYKCKLYLNQGWVMFSNVVFDGPSPITTLRVLYTKKQNNGGDIVVKLDNTDGTEIARSELVSTGAWSDDEEFQQVDFAINVDGVHDLYFTTEGGGWVAGWGGDQAYALISFDLLPAETLRSTFMEFAQVKAVGRYLRANRV